jgi:hypothetical protein
MTIVLNILKGFNFLPVFAPRGFFFLKKKSSHEAEKRGKTFPFDSKNVSENHR